MNVIQEIYNRYLAEDKRTGDPMRETSISMIDHPRMTLDLAFDQELGPEDMHNGQRSARITTELPLKHAARFFYALASQQETYLQDCAFLDDKLTRMGMTVIKKENSLCVCRVPQQLLKELGENGLEIPGIYKGGPEAMWTGETDAESGLIIKDLKKPVYGNMPKIYSLASKKAGTEEQIKEHMAGIDQAIDQVRQAHALECIRRKDW